MAVKRTLGHDLPEKPGPQEEELPVDPGRAAQDLAVTCVSCGYIQRGQPVDRCPECGLLFASQLRDPTPWSLSPRIWSAWWLTAVAAWRWDRRIRVRSGLIPATEPSARFAGRSIMLAAVGFGAGFSAVSCPTGPMPGVLVHALAYTLVGMCAAAVLLLVLQHGLKIAVRGRWRRELSFVPASIDYSTAWWPPIALVVFVVAGLARMFDGQSVALAAMFTGGGFLVWGTWLWGSASESENVRFVGIRVLAMVLAIAAGVSWTWLAVSASRQAIINRLTKSTTPPRPAITYCIIVDLADDPEALSTAKLGLTALGVKGQNCAVLRGKDCTVAGIEQAFFNAGVALWPQDRFIFYMNYRGALDSTGTLRLSDGVLAGTTIARLLNGVPTSRITALIEAENGVDLLRDLRGNCDAVAVTCPDLPEVNFDRGLTDLWEALRDSDSDSNKDGRITLEEAFEAEYEPLKSRLLTARERLYERGIRMSDATPLLEEMGAADKTDFWVPTPPPQPK